MTRALITGITGQDGTYLAERLITEGSEVHGLVATPPTPAEAAWLPDAAAVHLVDLRDDDAVASLVRQVAPDEIYNLGGISSVGFSWSQPVLTGAVSGLGAIGVYEAAWRVQEEAGRAVRVVQASSAEVFGQPKSSPQDESTAIQPVSPYGAAKAYAHLAAAVYRGRGLGVCSLILYNHESPRRPEASVTRKITAAAARICRQGGTVTLGNLEARRDWGWAPDYVEAMVRAARSPAADDYVIATGVSHSVADFAAAAFSAAGVANWRSHVATDPRFERPADAAQQVGDASKARHNLGWAPTVDFKELVRRMVAHDLSLLA
jgi:GDPmannose 4,6-dehydratase